MIVSAGLSPAWQQVLVIDGFAPGEVNRAAEAYWCSSGKVINVGVAVNHLCGGQPNSNLILAPIGGSACAAIEQDLATMGVACRRTRVQSPTRICTTIVDRTARTATELVENAGPISASELAAFSSTFAEAAQNATAVVLTGSLPAGAPRDYFRQLLSLSSATAVLDARGPELLAALEARPAVVKPNRAELSATLGRPLEDDDSLRAAMTELLKQGAQAVVVSDGARATWAATDGEFYKLVPPTVDRVINSIGCGDCMAAGIAWSLSRGAGLRESVKAGLDAAAANLQTLLPADLDGRRQQSSRR